MGSNYVGKDCGAKLSYVCSLPTNNLPERKFIVISSSESILSFGIKEVVTLAELCFIFYVGCFSCNDS